jgi:hypothetical protein
MTRLDPGRKAMCGLLSPSSSRSKSASSPEEILLAARLSAHVSGIMLESMNDAYEMSGATGWKTKSVL